MYGMRTGVVDSIVVYYYKLMEIVRRAWLVVM